MELCKISFCRISVCTAPAAVLAACLPPLLLLLFPCSWGESRGLCLFTERFVSFALLLTLGGCDPGLQNPRVPTESPVLHLNHELCGARALEALAVPADIAPLASRALRRLCCVFAYHTSNGWCPEIGSELLLVALCVLLYDSGLRTLLPSVFHQCPLSASCFLQITCSHPISFAAFLYPPALLLLLINFLHVAPGEFACQRNKTKLHCSAEHAARHQQPAGPRAAPSANTAWLTWVCSQSAWVAPGSVSSFVWHSFFINLLPDSEHEAWRQASIVSKEPFIGQGSLGLHT